MNARDDHGVRHVVRANVGTVYWLACLIWPDRMHADPRPVTCLWCAAGVRPR